MRSLMHANVKLENCRGILEKSRSWQTVGDGGCGGAEIYWSRGVQEESVREAKEPAVGVLNSFLMLTDPGGGKRSPALGCLREVGA